MGGITSYKCPDCKAPVGVYFLCECKDNKIVLKSDLRKLVDEMRVDGHFYLGDGHFDYEKRGIDYHRGKQLLEDADKLEAVLNKEVGER